MEIKIKRQELMKTIKRLKIVEELPKEVLQEYTRLLKIKEDSGDFASLVNGFQIRIADIFCQEGQAFQDYLQLPKFRSMSPHLQKTLHQIFQTIWRECHESRHKQHLINARKQIQQITTQFKNRGQAEKFHLGLLKLFRESHLCPRSKPKASAAEVEPKRISQSNLFASNGMGQPRQDMDNKINQSQNPNIFPCYPPYPMNPGTKMQAQEMGYIMEKDQPQEAPLFDVPRFPAMQPYFPPEFFQNQQMAFQEQGGMPFQPHPPAHHVQPQPPQIKNIFGEESKGFIMKKFITYSFIQCVCEGKHGFEQGQSFKCAVCQYCYHYNCLRIDRATKEEVVCPICNLKKETIFCKVVQEPIKFNWYLQQEKNLNQFKLEMSEEESQQILESKRNGLDCQIRFLKIDGKSLKKEKKALQGFVTEGGILHKQVKHSEITLPEFNFQNTQPIAIDITLRYEEEQVFTPKLYFFSVFLVSLRKVDEIVMELFDSNQCFDQSYMRQFLGGGDKIDVKFEQKNTVRGLIKYPVRGSECQHPEVFDYQKFLQLINDLKQDRQTELLCPICSRVCPGFKYDALIYKKINEFADYENEKPEGFELYRNGEWNWKVMPRYVFDNESGGPSSEKSMDLDPEKDDNEDMAKMEEE